MRQALLLTKETTRGAFNTSATNADKAHIRLTGDGAFPERSVPNIYYVKDAAGSNRNVQVDYGTRTSVLRFETLLYASQAALIIPWGCNLIPKGLDFQNPYTFTVDHLIQLEDAGNTVLYKRYLGATPQDFTLRANNQGDGQKFAVSASFWITGVASITSTDFVTPSLSSFPADLPMKFQQLTGGINLGAVRTGFKNFELSVKHNTKGIYDESVYPQVVGWYGRDVSMKADFRYKSAADRTALEAVAAQAVSVTLANGTGSGTTSIVFDFKANNIITAVNDSLSLGDAFYQSVTNQPMVDPTAATDLTATVTVTP